MEIKFSKEDLEQVQRIARAEIKRYLWELQKVLVADTDKDDRKAFGIE